MASKDKADVLKAAVWIMTIVTVAMAVVVWLQGFNGQYDRISTYKLFPLFGLTAFTLMWGHYIASAVRQFLNIEPAALARYFSITAWMVLVAILLHPGLLVWQLWRDGFGLPPGSYLENYVSPTLRGAAIVSSVSLLAFLAFELHRKYKDRKWWRWVQFGSDTAMIGVLYHSFKLGSHTQDGWFRGVWIFYGITYVIALAYIYYRKYRPVAS